LFVINIVYARRGKGEREGGREERERERKSIKGSFSAILFFEFHAY